MIKSVTLCFLLCFISVLSLTGFKKAENIPLPQTVLWVWEARQDLRSLSSKQIGLAIYIGTVTLNEKNISVTPSQQKMALPPHIYRMAVIHIDAPASKHLTLDQKTLKNTVDAIISLYHDSDMKDLQLDFSATQSQQTFLVEVVKQVRKKLQRDAMLSMTALAYWCTSDRFIGKNHLPIDLVVPMYFSLGGKEQKKQFIKHFPTHIHLLAPECQQAIGVATFETWQVPLHAQVPLFIFTRGTWTPLSIQQAVTLSHRIHAFTCL